MAILEQFIAAFAATVGLISDGMQYGWTSPIIPVLQSPDSEVDIQTSDIVWLENLPSLAAFIGIPFTIYNVNRRGRKMSIIISACLKLIAWSLIGYARSVEILLLGRFIHGFASNAAFVSAPMYIAEISNKKIRGALLSLVYMMMLLGVFLMYCIGPYTSILFSSLIGAFILILQISMFCLMPKSPYFLLLNGERVKAGESLVWLRGSESVEDELENLTEVVDRQQSQSGRLIDLFKIASNRKALFIIVFLNGVQHFSGISVMVMNLQTILQSSTVVNPNIATVVFAFIMMVAAISASFLVDIVGRKTLLIASSILTAASLFTLAVYFTVLNNGGIDVAYRWIPIVAVMVYALAFKSGLGMVPIITTGELFPTSVKGMGMAIADSSYVLFAFFSIYLYQFLVQNYSIQVPFYIFTVCCFSSVYVTQFYIPETKGKSLDEIQVMLKQKGSSNSYEALD